MGFFVENKGNLEPELPSVEENLPKAPSAPDDEPAFAVTL